ncbi:MAG: TerB family tellurite resistance protein [Candidatus Thiodiazotropha sp.]
MLKSIFDYFNTHLMPDSAASLPELERQLNTAVAALMFEIAASDFEQAPEEQAEILSAIEKHFDLDEQAAQDLMRLGEREHAASTDYFQFTSLINKHYSSEQKVSLIEALWRVAFADQKLHQYEEHVIRRLSELLYVPHSDFIAAKLRMLKSF